MSSGAQQNCRLQAAKIQLSTRLKDFVIFSRHDKHIMTQTLTERMAERALTLTRGDWAEATRQLCQLAETQPDLLLELTRPYLRGAAAKAIHLAARRRDAASTPAAPVAVRTPANLGAANTGAGQAIGKSVWDEIISHMQTDTEMDSEQHEKALRVIAKAFAARRLDERAAKNAAWKRPL
jgi:hypothetical protein